MKIIIKLKGGSQYKVDLEKNKMYISSKVIRIVESENVRDTLEDHIVLPLFMLEGLDYEETEK